MFWVVLGLALSIFFVAINHRRQAQRVDGRLETLEIRQRLNFDWLCRQIKRGGHPVNMRPTVVVNYKVQNDEVASAAGASWSDDGLKTQTLEESQDSGFRPRQSWIAKP